MFSFLALSILAIGVSNAAISIDVDDVNSKTTVYYTGTLSSIYDYLSDDDSVTASTQFFGANTNYALFASMINALDDIEIVFCREEYEQLMYYTTIGLDALQICDTTTMGYVTGTAGLASTSAANSIGLTISAKTCNDTTTSVPRRRQLVRRLLQTTTSTATTSTMNTSTATSSAVLDYSSDGIVSIETRVDTSGAANISESNITIDARSLLYIDGAADDLCDGDYLLSADAFSASEYANVLVLLCRDTFTSLRSAACSGRGILYLTDSASEIPIADDGAGYVYIYACESTSMDEDASDSRRYSIVDGRSLIVDDYNTSTTTSSQTTTRCGGSNAASGCNTNTTTTTSATDVTTRTADTTTTDNTTDDTTTTQTVTRCDTTNGIGCTTTTSTMNATRTAVTTTAQTTADTTATRTADTTTRTADATTRTPDSSTSTTRTADNTTTPSCCFAWREDCAAETVLVTWCSLSQAVNYEIYLNQSLYASLSSSIDELVVSGMSCGSGQYEIPVHISAVFQTSPVVQSDLLRCNYTDPTHAPSPQPSQSPTVDTTDTRTTADTTATRTADTTRCDGSNTASGCTTSTTTLVTDTTRTSTSTTDETTTRTADATTRTPDSSTSTRTANTTDTRTTDDTTTRTADYTTTTTVTDVSTMDTTDTGYSTSTNTTDDDTDGNWTTTATVPVTDSTTTDVNATDVRTSDSKLFAISMSAILFISAIVGYVL